MGIFKGIVRVVPLDGPGGSSSSSSSSRSSASSSKADRELQLAIARGKLTAKNWARLSRDESIATNFWEELLLA